MKQYFIILVISCSRFLRYILIHFHINTEGDQDRKVVERPQHLGKSYVEVRFGCTLKKVRKGERFTNKEYFE